MEKYVAYYRVSTDEQGKSGLGLNSQKLSVTSFIKGNGILVGEFQDIESGASEVRLGMQHAIKSCIDNKATLVVKELSRITRGGFKYRQLLDESGINFIECDSPYDPEIVKDIKFSLAKEERKKIKERTSLALKQIKNKISNGDIHISKSGNVVKYLGNPKNLTNKSREISIKVRKKIAYENTDSKKAGAFITVLKNSGCSYKDISIKLNEAGFKTPRGSVFYPVQVKRLYERYNFDY